MKKGQVQLHVTQPVAEETMHSPPSATKATPNQNPEPARAGTSTENTVRGAFDDVALLIGSVAVIHHIEPCKRRAITDFGSGSI